MVVSSVPEVAVHRDTMFVQGNASAVDFPTKALQVELFGNVKYVLNISTFVYIVCV